MRQRRQLFSGADRGAKRGSRVAPPLVGLPGDLELRQPFELAEIARLAQRAIERGHGLARDRRIVPEFEMRRSQQRDQRVARERRGDELEHQIERGGHRLGRERQRVRRLIRNAGAAKRARARGTDTAAAACRRPRCAPGRWLTSRQQGLATIGLQPPRDANQLLFAIAAGEPLHGPAAPPAPRAWARSRPGAVPVDLLQAGQPVVNPLVKAGRQHAVGRRRDRSSRVRACASADRSRRHTVRRDRQSSRRP